MLYGNKVPGEFQSGGIETNVNDFDAMTLALLDGQCAGSFYRFLKIRINDDEIFK